MPAAKTPVDPFADLFKAATVTEKERKREDRADVEVAPVWIERVEKLFRENQKATFPVTEKAQFDAFALMLRAACDRSELKISANCRAVYSGEGDDATLTGLTLSVGERRGPAKKTTGEES